MGQIFKPFLILSKGVFVNIRLARKKWNCQATERMVDEIILVSCYCYCMYSFTKASLIVHIFIRVNKNFQSFIASACMFLLFILFENKSHSKALKVVYHNTIKHVFIPLCFLKTLCLHFVSGLESIWGRMGSFRIKASLNPL